MQNTLLPDCKLPLYSFHLIREKNTRKNVGILILDLLGFHAVVDLLSTQFEIHHVQSVCTTYGEQKGA